MRSLSTVLLFVLSSLALVQAQFDKGKTWTQLETVLNAPDYKHAHWGILVAELDTGRILYELNPDKLFAPASTTKLFSVAAALDALGADYRFETPVLRRGEVEAGVLAGDLILVASGDLSMGGRTDKDGRIAFKDTDHTYANGSENAVLTETDPLVGLHELARQVAASGIKRVRGDILVDERLFDRTDSTGSGPLRVSPIMINDNLIDFIIAPGPTAGTPASVDWRPRSPLHVVDARVETVDHGKPVQVSVTRAATGRFILRGQVPAGRKPLIRVLEVEDPANSARSFFIEALMRAGVVVDASPLTPNPAEKLPPRESLPGFPRVALLTSPPFSDSARLILKVSHNLQASTLPLLVAAKNGKRTLADGLRLQRDFLLRAGVEADTVSFGGGAGGARADCTTPRATIQLLRYMATRPDFKHFEAALPSLGVDGTLADVVKPDSPARGKVQAKTGTLFWENTMNGSYLLTSKALAGYMTTAQGKKLVFAMFVNNTHIPRANLTTREGRVLGKLCEIIYSGE